MKDQDVLMQFNNSLFDIRETFHKTGRLDDSNTKLDIVSRLLCLEVASVYDSTEGIPSLESLLESNKNNSGLIARINKALSKASQLDIFLNSNGESLLGPIHHLGLPESESEIAGRMVDLIVKTFNGHLRASTSPENFELVNECFGHFIRDNFRNNIEDAQYMTPPEVVNFICELAMDEIYKLSTRKKKKFIVCDPACGVGSFLAQFYKLWLHSKISGKAEIVLVGQDKVDRMARLTKLNMLLFGIKNAIVSRGNSLLPGSILDNYQEVFDIILTNPPFGARFHTTELTLHSKQFFPCLHNVIQSTDSNLDSELLFIDRYISLLRPGGTALMVVPDTIISASGLPQLIRDYLSKNCTIISITELPAVTFAQAGTRTKTCVLHFKKQKPDFHKSVYFSCVKSLGFEVASRKGAPYKRPEGKNELPQVVQSIRTHDKKVLNKTAVLSTSPSCVSVAYTKLFDESWTPNYHSATRYATLAKLNEKSIEDGFELVKLRDAVTLPNQHKRNARRTPNSKCISILHVGDFGALNIKELMDYSPKYPGQPCNPGDILFSKINPRIPRVLVVPQLNCPLSCSTEFEVMQAKEPFISYEIMSLLLMSYAQSQIQSLTSGTSSSHNRIKTEQLMDVLLPVPNTKKKRTLVYKHLVDNFAKAHTSLIRASIKLYENWKEINNL
jgi:predicted RNA methylase